MRKQASFHWRACKAGLAWLNNLLGLFGLVIFFAALVGGTVIPSLVTGFPRWAEVLIGAGAFFLIYAEGAYRLQEPEAPGQPQIFLTLGPGSHLVTQTGGLTVVTNPDQTPNFAPPAPEDVGSSTPTEPSPADGKADESG